MRSKTMKRQHFVGVKKSLGMGNASGVFVLTESGRNLARECLENNQYAGPAPVPLYQYTEVVRRQKLKSNWLNPASAPDAPSSIWWWNPTSCRRSGRR